MPAQLHYIRETLKINVRCWGTPWPVDWEILEMIQSAHSPPTDGDVRCFYA